MHREKATRDFLGILNENWMAASRDLGPHALRLYLYLASNANGYRFALSQRAVQEAIGMPRSTYHDQFWVLVNKGYLIKGSGNTYHFFETPQPRVGTDDVNCMSSNGLDFEIDPHTGEVYPKDDMSCPPEEREINIMTDDDGYCEVNIDSIPKKEFVF